MVYLAFGRDHASVNPQSSPAEPLAAFPRSTPLTPGKNVLVLVGEEGIHHLLVGTKDRMVVDIGQAEIVDVDADLERFRRRG